MRNFTATADVYVTLPTQQIQAAGGEAEEFLLLREMHHRMANMLTLLTAHLWREFRSSKTTQVRGSLLRFEARIAAFGALHRLLAVGATIRPIDVGRYVEELCHSLSEAVLTPLGVRCEVSAGDGVLLSRTCERLGLIIAVLAGHTVHSIVLEVPDAELLAGASGSKRVGVWAVATLATDAGGWRSINRVGLPMIHPLFTQFNETSATGSMPGVRPMTSRPMAGLSAKRSPASLPPTERRRIRERTVRRSPIASSPTSSRTRSALKRRLASRNGTAVP